MPGYKTNFSFQNKHIKGYRTQNLSRLCKFTFLVLSFSLIIYSPLSAQNSVHWGEVSLNSSSVYSEVPLKTQYFSKDTVFILSSNGFFYSFDGGATFAKTAITGNERSFHFVTSKTGYMVGSSGLFARTTNSGINWQQIASPTPWLFAVGFINETKGIVVGDNGSIYRTFNGGNTWTNIASGNSQYLTAVKWITDRIVLVGGYNGTMLRSSDGGTSFNQVTIPVSNISAIDYYSAEYGHVGDSMKVSLYDQSFILATGSLQTILRSTDYGLTWTNVAPEEPSLQWKKTFSEVSIADCKLAYSYGWNFYNGVKQNTLLVSTDAGQSWQNHSLPDTLIPESFDFYDHYNLIGYREMTGEQTALKYKYIYEDVIVLTPGIPGLVFSNKQKIPLTWDSNIIQEVSLSYSLDGGNSWIFIANAPAGTKYYEWETPLDPPTANCFIKIQKKADGSIADLSDFAMVIRAEFWQNYSNGIQNELRAASFPTNSVAYVAGDGGVIAKSVDSAKTFNVLTTQFSNKINSISFYDAQNGIAGGDGGLVVKTTDGGITWIPITSLSIVNVRKVQFVDLLKIIILPVNSGYLYISNSGGVSWTMIESAHIINDFCYKNETGFAVGEQGLVLKSSDNIFSWQPVSTGITSNLISVSFHNQDIGYIATSSQYLLTTKNGGDNWYLSNTGFNNDLIEVKAVSSRTAYALFGDGYIYSTDNNGLSWERQNFRYHNILPQYYNTLAFSPVSTNHRGLCGISAGKTGTIIRKSFGLPEHKLEFMTQPIQYDYIAGFDTTSFRWRGAGVRFITVASINMKTGIRVQHASGLKLQDEWFTLPIPSNMPGKLKIEITSSDDPNLRVVSDSIVNILGYLLNTLPTLPIIDSTQEDERYKGRSLSSFNYRNYMIGQWFFSYPVGWQNIYSFTNGIDSNKVVLPRFDYASGLQTFTIDSLNRFVLYDTWQNTEDEASLYASTNAGVSWEHRYTFITAPDSLRKISVKWLDANTALTNRNGITKTTDGGATWFNAAITDPGATPNIVKFAFYDSQSGFARSKSGGIYFTGNRGNNWTKLYQDTLSPVINSFEHSVDYVILNRNVHYAVTVSFDTVRWNYFYNLRRSTNGGANWSKISEFQLRQYPALDQYSNTDILHFISDSTAILLGPQFHAHVWNEFQSDFITEDGGLTWRNVRHRHPAGLIDHKQDISTASVKFNEYILASRWGGQIIVYNGFDLNPLVGIKDEQQVANPTEMSLGQNYPNPFNPATRIRYSITSKSDVSLVLYNMLGQKVMQLVQEVKNPGNYEVQFNGSNLASGVYLYQLRAGSFTAVKKLILLK